MLRLILIIAAAVTLECQLVSLETDRASLAALFPWIKLTCSNESQEICNNTVADDKCTTLFPDDASCDDPANAPFLDLCLKTCKQCCKDPRYSCSNKKEPRIPCENMTQADCDSTEALMHDFAVNDCPLTCGKCNETGSSGCEDSDPEACQKFLDMNLCNDYRYHEDMVKDCPKTCNFCEEHDQLYSTPSAGGSPGGASASNGQSAAAGSGTTQPGSSGTTVPGGTATTSGPCVDSASNCQTLKNLCNDPTYHEIMLQRCPLTCGFCAGNPTTSICVDNSTNCAVWAQTGFCSSTTYTEEEKKAYCAKTCNLC